MYIKQVRIHNFKRFSDWYEVDLTSGTNILVGPNEVGKSTIIEAIHLALTGFYQGRYIRNDISQYLFNQHAVESYLASVQAGAAIDPPTMEIELVFDDDCPKMRGNHNAQHVEKTGLFYKICFDSETYQDEYNRLLQTRDLTTLPVEYYHVVWRFFHRDDIMSRSIPYHSSFIDTTTQHQAPADLYVSHIIKNKLDDNDKVSITQSYRKAQQTFMADEAILGINAKLAEMASIDGQNVTLSIDLSSRRAWEDALTAYLDKIPFHYLGKGGQCYIKTKLALAQQENDEPGITLIEEPENHLSFAKLNGLIRTILENNDNQQLIITTHSSFVLNKLKLSSLILLSPNGKFRLTGLSEDTITYFEKLAGYDTLRLLLSKKTILVEGDSDELVIQRAYKDRTGHLPIEDGIDVLCVRGLAFLRFLEIAKALQLNVAVVTDNDGNVDALRDKYKDYIGEHATPNIKICFDADIDTKPTFSIPEGDTTLPTEFNFNTLEPKMLKANGLAVLQRIFAGYDTNAKILRHMHADKGLTGLAFFKTEEVLNYPNYIQEAIEWANE